LAVGQGQRLTLLGGIVINTGTLTAPGGTITIAAIPGQRMLRLSDSNSPLSIDLPLDPNEAINPTSFTPQSLPALLTGGLADATGLTIENGIVSLTATKTPIATAPGSLTLAGRVNADAGISGNGGTVLANASKTLVTGNISAEGSSTSGNGGFVETSGKSLTIAPSTTVSTRAPRGSKGTWLLDPTNLEVVATGGIGTIATGTNSTADSTISAGTIVTALDGNNVNLQATNSITVSAAINAIGNANTGNLTLDAPTTNLNALITLQSGGNLNGTAATVNVGTGGTVQNGVDAAAAGGTVNLAAATYTLNQEVGINKNLTVRGVAANQTKVSGNNAVRVFNIDSGTVTLDSMSILDGKVNGNGGGVKIGDGVVLTIANTSVANNIATSIAGGIDNAGTLRLLNSELSNNSAQYVGGLYNTGTATVINSTISGNISNDRGGGDGGGIFNTNTLTVNNSTITNNIAGNAGGGLYNLGTAQVSNSIIAGNTATDVNNAEVQNNASFSTQVGTFTSLGNNLVGQNGNAGGFTRVPSDILVPGAIATQIGSLANNGGTTQTHAVLIGSAAIDGANPATATTTGQNGNAIAGTARDIGAYEFGGFQFTLNPVSGNNQSAVVNTAFQPLIVNVVPNILGQQVAGGTIVAFTPTSNANGAGIT
ncbi:MAG: hypothetical protein LH647_02440, partial [Leptolyngbyaceae cyanobacterium CAN_BIN12]|nr:hypothetical protein [Leptolyngbyaceae cyanobacterium CAN_BIN12]